MPHFLLNFKIKTLYCHRKLWVRMKGQLFLLLPCSSDLSSSMPPHLNALLLPLASVITASTGLGAKAALGQRSHTGKPGTRRMRLSKVKAGLVGNSGNLGNGQSTEARFKKPLLPCPSSNAWGYGSTVTWTSDFPSGAEIQAFKV